jgi:hypothetical protein
MDSQDATLVDSDGKDIPDSADSCPGTVAGAPVKGSGCPQLLH